MQAPLWIEQLYLPDKPIANTGILVTLTGQLDASRFGEAVRIVVSETDTLRIRLSMEMMDDKGDSALRDGLVQDIEDIDGSIGQFLDFARLRDSEAAVPDTDLSRQREVVDAFFAAARGGDFQALVAVLHPDVVLRADGGALRPDDSVVVHGAEAVAKRALMFARLSPYVRPALVNGVAGVVVAPGGRPFSVMGFTVVGDRVVAIDALSDPERLRELDLTVLD